MATAPPISRLARPGSRLKAPSIYAWRDDRWVQLFHEVGYPAGLQHMMTLDVTNKLLTSDTKIRITSNMELFWDRIFLAASPTVSDLQDPRGASLACRLAFPRISARVFSRRPTPQSVRLWEHRQHSALEADDGQLHPLRRRSGTCSNSRMIAMSLWEEAKKSTLQFPVRAFDPVPGRVPAVLHPEDRQLLQGHGPVHGVS